jgi:uncharacterized protein
MTTQPHAPGSPSAAPAATGSGFADPGPLGLAAFALTTFVLSCMNTGIFKAEPVVFGLALFYGGAGQLIAGIWEFAKGNTFGATAFVSYGAFWMSFWYLTNHTDLSGGTPKQAQHGIGLWLFAWFIFTLYMLIASLKTNTALIAVFGLLTLTFLALAIGNASQDPTAASHDALIKIGGWLGLLTAVAAWYTSFAVVTNSTFKRAVLPVGPIA